MPRAVKPPRLYFIRRQDRPGSWVILDHGRQQWLNLRENQIDLAEQDLRDYVNGCYVRREPPEPPEPQSLWAASVRNRPGFVYFATCDLPEMPDFPIKIGFSIKVGVRLPALQTGMPWPLVVLAKTPGTLEREGCFHLTYMHLRMTGEWFRRGPDLMSHIAELAAEALRPTVANDMREQTSTNAIGVAR